MMKVKVAEAGKGLHPSEIVVAIKTNQGNQNLVVDRRSLLIGGYIAVGYPIRENADTFLIELPRETSSGSWRVWVDKNQLLDLETERRTA